MPPAVAGDWLHTAAGRLRLGWRLLLFLVVGIVVTATVALLLPPSPLGGSAAILAGALLGGWMMLAREGRTPAALGFHLSAGSFRESLGGLLVGVLVAGGAVGGMVLAGAARWVPDAGSGGEWLAGAGSALLFLALPAAAEEALVRGYPLQALTEAWGTGWALLVTSTLFGLMHLGNPGVTPLAAVNVAVAGLWLGVVYLRTGSLWWATGAHLGWNWASAYLADLPVSGLRLFDAPLYDGVTLGPAWLGGGTFGPEGSVMATVALGGAAWLCWRAGWLRPSPAVRAARPLIAEAWGTGVSLPPNNDLKGSEERR